jgi:nucleotide-binding universal stress UspA family protein
MLNNINCILYASDFGPDSRKGFRMAVTLAQTNQARLIFMHAVEPLGHTAEMMINSYMTEEQLETMQSKALDTIREEINGRIKNFSEEELPADYALPHGGPECRIEQGRAVDRILGVAQEVEADLIVMGSRTHSALSQMVVGSTAHQVLFRSDRPVLIVPMADTETNRS